LIEIFDEDHVVSALVVEQFIDYLSCQHYAEPAWAKALIFSNSYMAKYVVRRTADGRMT
jgi:hypothetical protein